jgi:hypothetical protein
MCLLLEFMQACPTAHCRAPRRKSPYLVSQHRVQAGGLQGGAVGVAAHAQHAARRQRDRVKVGLRAHSTKFGYALSTGRRMRSMQGAAAARLRQSPAVHAAHTGALSSPLSAAMPQALY